MIIDVAARSALALRDEAISLCSTIRPRKGVSRNNAALTFHFLLLSSLIFLLPSCSPAVQPALIQTIPVYSTPAASPWLTEMYDCANKMSIFLNVSADDPEIYLRVGEPETLTSPAYQIDEEEILIVAHRESPVQNLTLEEAQALFAGQGDPSALIWGYAQGEDVQFLFDQFVMKGRGVSSFARIAVSPQKMSDILNADSNSVGILPRHWLMGNAREVYSAGKFPVLAVTKTEAQGAIQKLIACLQK